MCDLDYLDLYCVVDVPDSCYLAYALSFSFAPDVIGAIAQYAFRSSPYPVVLR
jgi:hypothetical protein